MLWLHSSSLIQWLVQNLREWLLQLNHEKGAKGWWNKDLRKMNRKSRWHILNVQTTPSFMPSYGVIWQSHMQFLSFLGHGLKGSSASLCALPPVLVLTNAEYWHCVSYMFRQGGGIHFSFMYWISMHSHAALIPISSLSHHPHTCMRHCSNTLNSIHYPRFDQHRYLVSRVWNHASYGVHWFEVSVDVDFCQYPWDGFRNPLYVRGAVK